MRWTPPPTDEQLRGFFAKLWAWRATLTELEQRLTDSMLAAALGQTGEPCAEPDEEAAAGEDGPSVARWLATPWGMTYTLRYR
jgi:hypothetical protein